MADFDELALKIAESRFAPMAIFLLESLKPFASVAKTAGLINDSPITHVTASLPWSKILCSIVQRPEAIEEFIRAIELKVEEVRGYAGS